MSKKDLESINDVLNELNVRLGFAVYSALGDDKKILHELKNDLVDLQSKYVKKIENKYYS